MGRVFVGGVRPRRRQVAQDHPSSYVLPAPDARDYKAWEGYMRDALLEKNRQEDVIMLASPSSPENLIRVLATIVPQVKTNALRWVRIYVAVPIEYRERVAAVLAPTKARFIHLDPARPIPQTEARVRWFFPDRYKP